MTTWPMWLSSLFLVAGAALCLIAATGVLRLPDFFMRMHAATKAGVVGCGLMLIGVGFADGTTGTWVKVAIALVFLLLTTPVAGHLLGRAAYVGGAPFWQGTAGDALHRVLPRGRFGAAAGGSRTGMARTALSPGEVSRRDVSRRDVSRNDVSRKDVPRKDVPSDPVAAGESIDTVVLALAKGPLMASAVTEAVALARRHDAELCGVAIIDVPRLSNVGPVPIGGGWHAQQMRERRIRLARQAAADVIQRFEEMAGAAGLRWAVRLEEGRPARVLAALAEPGCVLAVAPGAWFDQGVLDLEVNVTRRLRWSGLRKDILVLGAPADTVAH